MVKCIGRVYKKKSTYWKGHLISSENLYKTHLEKKTENGKPNKKNLDIFKRLKIYLIFF